MIGSKSGILLLLVALVASLCHASIDRQPIKVTHRNSGPSYDLEPEDVEKVKVPTDETSGSGSSSANDGPVMMTPFRPFASNKPEESSDDDQGIRHISIRRILLIPMRPPQAADGSPVETSEGGATREPMWPFLLPPKRFQQHLFGADSASRNPTPDSSEERPKFESSKPNNDGTEREDTGLERPSSTQDDQTVDPVHMLVNMMLNTLNSVARHQQAANNNEPHNFFSDLNKEASAKPTSDGSNDKPVDSLMKPNSTNESKEDVIEIDGKKYLRKVIINRHVGENMVFVTRRLIFVPMNETDSTTTNAPTPIATELPIVPSTTQRKPAEEATTVSQPPSTPAPVMKADEQPVLVKEATEPVPDKVDQVAKEVSSTAKP